MLGFAALPNLATGSDLQVYLLKKQDKLMNTEIAERYYHAVWARIESEVLAINGLFNHQGVKGSGNERVLLDLLRKFLPKRYAIDTGVVVDRNGNQSKQCDIVIYDALNYPELLSLTSAKFFPVDFVYATIEVKTTLDAQKTLEAADNIRSVQSLDYIKQSFRQSPTTPIEELNNNTVLLEIKDTSAPIGIIFSYFTDTSNFDTYKNWFKPSIDGIGPSHIFAMDQGILFDTAKNEVFGLLSPYIEGDAYHTREDGHIKTINKKKWVNIGNRDYPLSKLENKEVAIDQCKVLLNFITILIELLTQKNLSPNISVHTDYLAKKSKAMLTVENGQIKPRFIHTRHFHG